MSRREMIWAAERVSALVFWCSLYFAAIVVQMVMFGVVGEMLMRTYYESQGRRPRQ